MIDCSQIGNIYVILDTEKGYMRVVGREIIKDFCLKHGDVRTRLDAWLAEAEEASWRKPHDIKEKYASASFLGDNRVVLNIKGNSYRLDIKVNYTYQVVKIERLGTHAEYSKWKW